MFKQKRSVLPGASPVRLASALLVMAMAVIGACDKVPLFAPTSSTITVSAPTRLLSSTGSTEIAAFVLEQSGTPVQNGTTVRFTATLGRVEPAEAQTLNGLASTMFFADGASGVAEVRAISGSAGGGADATNVVQLTIGAAAVNTVTLRANPGSVGPSGGSVELVATVVGVDGQTLSGVGVTFNTDQGTLNASNVTTGADGEARATLTTSQEATVSATAGVTTSSTVTVTVRSGPIVSIACTPASGTGNCAAVQADTTNNTATVLFTVTKATGSSTLRTATLDFGDGASSSLGNLAGGSATVTRTYDGPSGSTAVSYTAVVQATDINSESASASTTVIVTPKAARPRLIVTLAAVTGTAVFGVGQPVTFTATVTPATDGADVVSSYEWTFGDSSSAVTNGASTSHVYTTNGTKVAIVEVTTTDGRTATARAEFIISGV
jgi:hypothetical protein